MPVTCGEGPARRARAQGRGRGGGVARPRVLVRTVSRPPGTVTGVVTTPVTLEPTNGPLSESLTANAQDGKEDAKCLFHGGW